MNEATVDTKPKTGGTKPQIALYQKVAAREEEILEKAFELLGSRNESVILGAVKTLLNKILPDLKSVELQGGVNSDGTRRPIELLINAGRGFIPATIQFNAPSTGGHTRTSTEIQSVSLAQESKEDNNSNTRDNQAGTS